MASNLEALETWAAVLLDRLEPGERGKLARSIGQDRVIFSGLIHRDREFARLRGKTDIAGNPLGGAVGIFQDDRKTGHRLALGILQLAMDHRHLCIGRPRA